jgi:hypothetical protein
MGNYLKPIGSEKLEGMDKIQRIMEIARYNENIPTPINEDKSTEYTKVLADGRTYKIDKEKNGYVLKRSLTESTSEFDYMEPMKNRKYYSSYSQAFKRLNLVVKEININEGQEKNVNLFYESADEAKKYILKMGGGETSEQVAQTPSPARAPVPAPAPSPVTKPSPTPNEEPMPSPDDLGLDDDMGGDDMDGDDNEPVTLKVIQKLTGKLAQKLRTLQEKEQEGQEEMSSKDIKYVINSILSAFDLNKLDDDDKEEIMNKFEGDDMGMDDMGGDDELAPDENTDLPAPGGDDELAPEGEMGEGFDDFDVKSKFSDFDDDDFTEMDLDTHKFEPKRPRHKINHPHIKPDEAGHLEDMLENIFSESKVDKILEGYFVLTENEKKSIGTVQKNKEVRKQKITKIKQLSESVSQEVGSTKFLNQNPTAKLIGKTNKKNLVFEMKGTQYRVNTKGQLI